MANDAEVRMGIKNTSTKLFLEALRTVPEGVYQDLRICFTAKGIGSQSSMQTYETAKVIPGATLTVEYGNEKNEFYGNPDLPLLWRDVHVPWFDEYSEPNYTKKQQVVTSLCMTGGRVEKVVVNLHQNASAKRTRSVPEFRRRFLPAVLQAGYEPDSGYAVFAYRLMGGEGFNHVRLVQSAYFTFSKTNMTMWERQGSQHERSVPAGLELVLERIPEGLKHGELKESHKNLLIEWFNLLAAKYSR